MAIRIGINPLTWTNDDLPALGGRTPLATCLREARRAGFEGIEMGHKFPRVASRLRPILAAHELALVSGWYSGRLLERSVAAEIKAVRDHLGLLAQLGSTVMVFAEVTGCVHGDRKTALSKRPRLGPRDWRDFGRALTEVARHLEGRGVRMAYHHHMGTVVETETDVDRLMAATGPTVGLLLDTGHLAFARGNALRVVRKHGRRINHVHCKDVRRKILAQARAGDWSFLDAVLAGAFTVPGDGDLDFTSTLAALKRRGYQGWLVVEAEQDPATAHPMTSARLGHSALNRIAADLGW